jgi:hypothetical protein
MTNFEPVRRRFTSRLVIGASSFLRHSGLVIRHSLAVLALVSLIASCSRPSSTHPAEAAIRSFLGRYFSTWSARDMEGYGACFDPQARIQFVAQNGEVVSEGTIDFLAGQKLAHERSESPMTERPLDMKIQGDEKIAQAAVTWVLTKGGKEERGTDFFTLRRVGDGWKIVSLVFYGE